MRVFVPAVQQGNEWVSPVDEVSGFDRLRIEDCASVVDRWVPERVRIIREDEGFRLAVADVPWLGDHGLVLRRQAADLIAPLVDGQAELLPLSCDHADLFFLHVTECRDALDFARSDLVRFSSGRVMTIREHFFDAEALQGVCCFRDSKMPRGPIYLTGSIVDSMTSAGLAGFGARLVWESETIDYSPIN